MGGQMPPLGYATGWGAEIDALLQNVNR